MFVTYLCSYNTYILEAKFKMVVFCFKVKNLARDAFSFFAGTKMSKKDNVVVLAMTISCHYNRDIGCNLKVVSSYGIAKNAVYFSHIKLFVHRKNRNAGNENIKKLFKWDL